MAWSSASSPCLWTQLSVRKEELPSQKSSAETSGPEKSQKSAVWKSPDAKRSVKRSCLPRLQQKWQLSLGFPSLRARSCRIGRLMECSRKSPMSLQSVEPRLTPRSLLHSARPLTVREDLGSPCLGGCRGRTSRHARSCKVPGRTSRPYCRHSTLIVPRTCET